jgi:hypothetical protein
MWLVVAAGLLGTSLAATARPRNATNAALWTEQLETITGTV